MSHTRPLLVPVLGSGWLLGILIGSLAEVPFFPVSGALVVAAVLFAAAREDTMARLAALALLAGLLGVGRANAATRLDRASQEIWRPLAGTTVALQGTVRAAESRGTATRLTVAVGGRPGFVRATVPFSPSFQEGATLILRGRLDPPVSDSRLARAGGADLERVFARHRVHGILRFPEVTVVTPGEPSRLTRLRFALRRILLLSLPEPAGSFYSSFLLSFDGDLPTTLRDRAAATGILHLLAISGSHLAAITGLVFLLAQAVGFSRRLASVAAVSATASFLTLVGFPESGIRSGIMAALVLFAYLLGRPAAGLRGLLVACTLMTLADPRVLLGDVGFQLSALAVFGLLTFFPLLTRAFARVPNPLGFRTLLLLTVSAEVATLPVVAYTFGRVPLVGPVTNIFAAVLFLPLLVLGGITLASSLVLPAALVVVAPLATAGSRLFLAVAEVGSRFPYHAVSVPRFSVSLFVASTLGLILGGMWLATTAVRRPAAAS